MSTNRISQAIPDDVLAQVTTALNQVKTLLQPYLQSLTMEERHDLPKMSDKSLSFVSKVNDYSVANAEFCPAYMSAAELNSDFNIVARLKPVNDVCEQICSNINDTMLLAGSEAYSAALLYYAGVQMAAKTGQANAKPVFEDLRQRFAGMGKKLKTATTA
ncbi:hypothetical protein [Parafilimonas sp.]|uniref:hypothetical protein n=1 Tax=Parafilimonas sp. TaxID=1969739 RepID=UPI0039E59274